MTSAFIFNHLYFNVFLSHFSKHGRKIEVLMVCDKENTPPDWFYQDGIHLNEKRQRGFSRYIYKKLKKSPASP